MKSECLQSAFCFIFIVIKSKKHKSNISTLEVNEIPHGKPDESIDNEGKLGSNQI